jgi:hypothetical protein
MGWRSAAPRAIPHLIQVKTGRPVSAECRAGEPDRWEVEMTAQVIWSQPREIPLRAQVEFTQFGVTLAGRVVGISHDIPMRYDLELEDGAIVSNIPEPAIGGLIALPRAATSH